MSVKAVKKHVLLLKAERDERTMNVQNSQIIGMKRNLVVKLQNSVQNRNDFGKYYSSSVI